MKMFYCYLINQETVLIILLSLCLYYSSVFMKSTLEPMLSTLSETFNGLSSCNDLNLIRTNSDILYAVFCRVKYLLGRTKCSNDS